MKRDLVRFQFFISDNNNFSFDLHSEPRQSLKIYTITVSEAKCIAVTFHVLVPHKIWGWDQNKTILRICFGHKDLGNWNGTTTEFRTTRFVYNL